MRADQIHPSVSIGWSYLTIASACSEAEQRESCRQLAVPQSPGRAKGFYPYPSSRRSRPR